MAKQKKNLQKAAAKFCTAERDLYLTCIWLTRAMAKFIRKSGAAEVTAYFDEDKNIKCYANN